VIEKKGRAAWLKSRRRVEANEFARVRILRAELFESVNFECLCCGIRLVESMHEEPPRSTGTIPSRTTSIPLCGSGTTGCHGLIQSKRIIASLVGNGTKPTIFGQRIRSIRFPDGEIVSWSFTPDHPRAFAHLNGEEVAN
jgi:hypothetical protein